MSLLNLKFSFLPLLLLVTLFSCQSIQVRPLLEVCLEQHIAMTSSNTLGPIYTGQLQQHQVIAPYNSSCLIAAGVCCLLQDEDAIAIFSFFIVY